MKDNEIKNDAFAVRLRRKRLAFIHADSALVTVIAVCWFKASLSRPALILMASTVVLTPALIAGVVIGWFATRRGSRLQGDIATAIFLSCVPFQCLELPRTASEALKPHVAIKLDAKLLDAYVGEYEMVPDNVFGTGAEVTIRRKEDHLVWQAFLDNAWQSALDLYPVSETDFSLKINGEQVTFIKNDKGEATAISRHKPGLPDSEGKKSKK